VLNGDQEVDWRLHIVFMPRRDPSVTIRPLDDSTRTVPGRLGGPVAGLLGLGILVP
jgi:hypothetical protein